MASVGQTTSQDGARSGRRLPFDASERKKIIVLAVLGVVCAAVVLPQLLKHKGPAEANASTATGAAATPLDIDAVVAEMRTSLTKPITNASGETVFTTVDEALELFVGGLRPQPVPVERLQLDVFGVPKAPVTDTPPPAAAAPSKAAPGLSPDDPLKAELAKLTLETVMISSRNQAAIINGQVLHVGETVEGFKITLIEIGQVTVAKDGRLAVLALKQEPKPGK
jgi:hypothetical protein